MFSHGGLILAQRRLDGELLDLLPADDPRAMASRSDLTRINYVMRHRAFMARLLRDFCGTQGPLIDLGAGDGLFMLGVARKLARDWPGVRLFLVDNKDIVSAQTRRQFASLGWHCEVLVGDVFDVLDRTAGGVITANLFLHHLPGDALLSLLRKIAGKADGFVACEPRRTPFALAASRLAFLLGANAVTSHDAVASVRAGFRDKELSRLWPGRGWSLKEYHARPFSHCFVARRQAAP